MNSELKHWGLYYQINWQTVTRDKNMNVKMSFVYFITLCTGIRRDI